jgi:hypothetical protein
VPGRLRANGAVFFGKTTTPEFGWKGVTDSPLSGVTRNPWNLERTPGGSSGGSAAAVLAGIGPLQSVPTPAVQSASRQRSAVLSAISRPSGKLRRTRRRPLAMLRMSAH